ncbi:dynein axonemal heavy chain 5-like [Saccostrea cucullata]|uniref:dynein axonemal heavy chain 5-like n=1 Tax=Saccostrea cuccullata TaxID=36930 RepID=UPI002ED2A6C8
MLEVWDSNQFFLDLQVPVLVRYPQTPNGVLLVNFDPYIFEVIKESEYMIKMNLEIPEAAKILVHSRDTLKAHASQMKFLLDEDKALRAEIPPIFQTLLGPSLKRVDSVIRPGLISHTWTSLNLPTYFTQVKEALAELQIIVKQISDIKTTRIDLMLKEISETLLCDLPERNPLTVSEFLQKMEEYTDQMAVDINKMSQVVEDAVKELVRIFLQRAHLEQSLLLESGASSDRSEIICKLILLDL